MPRRSRFGPLKNSKINLLNKHLVPTKMTETKAIQVEMNKNDKHNITHMPATSGTDTDATKHTVAVGKIISKMQMKKSEATHHERNLSNGPKILPKTTNS